MICKSFFIPLLGFFTFGMTKIPVDFDMNVSTMLGEIKAAKLSVHRSGLENKHLLYPLQDGPFRTGNEKGSLESMNDWNASKCVPFKAVFDPALTGRIVKSLIPKLRSYGKFEEKASWDGKETSISRKDAGDSLSPYIKIPLDANFDFLKNIEQYKNLAEQVLSEFQGQIEYDNYEIHYLNGAQVDLTVRYRRIFRGGVLRGNVSYASVSFDVAATVISVQVKWPTFISDQDTNRVYANKKKRDFDEIQASVQDYIANVPAISNGVLESGSSKGSVKNPQKGLVESLTLSWIPSGAEDSSWIIPGFTFVLAISYDDNIKIYPYFDQLYFQ